MSERENPKDLSGDQQSCSVPYVRGMFQHVLDPPGKRSDPKNRQWAINDHSFYVDEASEVIHWFGITNPYPPPTESLYGLGSHLFIGHATAPHPLGPWTEHPHIFTEPEEDGHIGSTFVVSRQDDYLMLYANKRVGRGLFFATSKDLFSWEKLADVGPILGGSTRDPCILKLDDGGYLLYTADSGYDGRTAIRLYKSNDLVNYETLEPALMGAKGTEHLGIESPFVFRRNGMYYLLANLSHHQYCETVIFASGSPYSFNWEKPLSTIFTHAPEVFEWKGKYYISHCGLEDRHWERPGLYLADLAFR